MSEPDGPCEREADNAEYYEREYDAIERIEQREREQKEDLLFPEALLDIAQARMMAWALERVFQS